MQKYKFIFLKLNIMSILNPHSIRDNNVSSEYTQISLGFPSLRVVLVQGGGVGETTNVKAFEVSVLCHPSIYATPEM